MGSIAIKELRYAKTKFLLDVNCSGEINSTDITNVKHKSGNSLR